MSDDDLERVRVEMYRRIDEWIEALKTDRDAEASGDPDAISQAKETKWQAIQALAIPVFGDEVRVRMEREIAHLDDKPNDPATNHRRGLIMLGRFLIDMRPFGRADVTDVAAGDALRQLSGKEGQLSRPVDTGLGPKGFDKIDRNLIRRYVLRVFVECEQTGKTQEEFLASLSKGPPHTQFRGWAQLVPLKERKMATAIGKALRDGQSLSNDQAALWNRINLVEIYGYLERLDPKTLHEGS